jgi:hypothetical protein
MPHQTFVASLLAALVLALPVPSQGALDTTFVPNEVLVSDPNQGLLGIIDPEFDSIRNFFCWVDRRGNLWVGAIDPATGLLVPPDGRGQLVDRGLATVGQIGNGPEWIYTDTGPQIVYTRLVNGVAVLARAYLQNRSWQGVALVDGVQRLAPVGSQDRGDLTPTIAYQGPLIGDIRPLYLRQLTDPTTEQMVPTTDLVRTPVARPIPDTNGVIFTRKMPDGVMPPRQVFSYDMDTQSLEQLTFDTGNKITAFMWQAPEYNNEYVFFALIGETRLGIYRYLDTDGDGIFSWTRVQFIDPPSLGDYIWSPEPFVYEGKSYIVMVTSESSDQKSLQIPSEIWMTDIDPHDPLYRRLSNDEIFNRKDPESYFSEVGPYVYISRQDGTGSKVMRLDTGLGVQAQTIN